MNNLLKRISTATILILSFVYFFFIAKPAITSTAIIIALMYIIFFEYTKLLNYKTLQFWIILPFYPVLPFLLGAYMSYFNNYKELLFYSILMAQIQDVGGYVFGSIFGKHKLAPNLSPKKSWEGLFGGYILLIFTLLSIFFINKHFSCGFFSNNYKLIIFTLLFSLVISIFATAGDLFESFLKRKAGIKDVGNILPGHGGLLDRIDSCLILIFIFFIFKDYLLRVFCIN